MIRIKQKTGPSKPKKMKKVKAAATDDDQGSKKIKKSKQTKPIKNKVKKGTKSGKVTKPKKQNKPGQFVLRRMTDDDTGRRSFPTSIDLDKQIRMLPKPDTQMNLTSEMKEMLKEADMGFSSISGVLETGDQEMGADEIRNNMKPKKKAYSGLPGWGNWANSKSMTQEMPDVPVPKKRQEEYKQRVFINKDLPPNPHVVRELPFPFTSKADYEASIAANIGPEFASRRLVGALSQIKKKVQYELDETWKRSH